MENTKIFTLEDVIKLHKYQFGPFDDISSCYHPYTCPNRNDGNHFENGRDLGVLIPTINGWICQCCDYIQHWSH